MKESSSKDSSSDEIKIGVGLDSAILPLKNKNLYLVQSVDYFYPLVDDPFLMGKISFANVVSDVYSTGVTAIDELKIIICVPEELTDEERDFAVPAIIDGFRDSAKEAKCALTINSITENPWCIIGGIATAVVPKTEIIFPIHAKAGDVLILTKPLGTRFATNGPLWMRADGDNWKKMSPHLSAQDIQEANDTAVKSMSMLNKIGAELMHKYKAHACTDVTGFGLAGHGENLLEYQEEQLNFMVDSLPIIKHIKTISECLGRLPQLLSGKMVETSGGLLISLPALNAQKFLLDFEAMTERECWIIGSVVEGQGKVIIADDVKVIEVLY